METLDDRLDRILDEAPDHQVMVARLVALLGDVVPCLGALHYRYEVGGLAAVGGSLDVLMADPGFALVADPVADPCHLAASRQPARPRVVHATRLLPRASFHQSAAYQDFYRAHDIEHIACVWLTGRPYGEPGFTGVVVPRAAAHGDFDAAELGALGRVLPSLVAATLVEVDATPERFGSPSIGAREAAVGFDRDGRVTAVTAAAERLLHGAEITAEELVGAVVDRARGALWSDLIPELRSRSLVWSRRRLLLPHPTRRDTVEVLVRLQPDGAGALVLDPPGPTLTSRVLDDLGLTGAEACVLQALADGLGTEQVAELLFVSEATVRTHIKRVLKKLGLTSRVQAALLMQRLCFDAPVDRWH